MVNSKCTTLWEGWQQNFYETSNHGWSGGPLALLSQYVAGITPLEPGFKTFAVKPSPGDLKRINTVVPTRYGLISIKMTSDSSAVRFELQVPAATKAFIDLSAINCREKRLYINGGLVSDTTRNPERFIAFYKNRKMICLPDKSTRNIN